MNESIVRESLQKLRDQKRQAAEIIRDTQRANANIQTKLDQMSLKYDREECQCRKLQEALRLSVNQVKCISEDSTEMMKVTEAMKTQLDQVLSMQDQDAAFRNKQEMSLCEAECRELAAEFHEAYKLYFNPMAVEDDQQRLEEQCKQLVRSIADSTSEEQILSTGTGNSEVQVTDETAFLLHDPAAEQCFKAFEVNLEEIQAVRVEIEKLKQLEDDLQAQACK